MYEQNAIEFVDEWSILCFGAKELGSKDPVTVVARPDFKKEYNADPDSDLMVCEELWHLLDASSVIVGHNLDRFDCRKINSRLLIHGFAPPSPYQTIDTLKVARRVFAMNSNKLQDLGVTLGIGKKEKHNGFATWKGAINGVKSDWDDMIRYCAGDITLTEAVYYAIQPWIQGGPNLAFLNGTPEGCPNCGVVGQMTRQGERKSRTMTYQRWLCGACCAWSRTVKSEKDATKPTFTN
jgi:hypothetical protein